MINVCGHFTLCCNLRWPEALITPENKLPPAPDLQPAVRSGAMCANAPDDFAFFGD